MRKKTKPTIVELIAEGLDYTDPSEGGFSIKHMRACQLANAAPELLAALKALQSWSFAQPWTIRESEVMKAIDAAILQAQGGAKLHPIILPDLGPTARAEMSLSKL